MNISEKSDVKLIEENIGVLKNRKTSSLFFILSILTIILICSFILSITTGRYSIPLKEMLEIFWGKLLGHDATWSQTVESVLFSVRLPRILVALMIGAALSISGASYQGLFKNPMVSPDILGASAGAGFGAAIAMLFSLGNVEVQISAFVFGMLAVGLSYLLSSIISRDNNAILVLVLTGMVVSSVFSAFISIIKYVADPDSKLPAITFWLMGGLSTATIKEVMILLIPMMIGVIPLLLLRYKMNVLSFGEEEAQAMGVETGKIRLIIIICSTLLTATAVSVSGMIGWVGLVIPHISRLLVGPNHKILIPTSLIVGAIFLLLVDDVARSLFVTEIPLGILTSIIGAPFFLYLLLNRKGSM